MPLIKNREDRLRTINARLNRWGGRPASTPDLARLCQVSESAIKQDIAYLKDEHGAPIAYDRKAKGYYYTHPFDLAASVTLTSQDLVTLHAALATLQQFQHLSLFADLRGTVDKLDKAVRFRSSPADDYGQHLLFESVPFTRGSEWVELFLQAIHQQQVVEFAHQRYDTEVTKTHRVFPYAVKEHRNRWYVVGWRLADQQIRVFGLDRVVAGSIHMLELESAHPNFDVEAYFRKALGVAIYDHPAEEVILSFTRQQGLHFQAQPFYPFSQHDVLLDTETEYRVRLHIVINDELIYELARLGPAVKVLSPLSLQQKLVTYLNRAAAQYELG